MFVRSPLTYLSGALRAINVHNSAVFIYSFRNYYYYYYIVKVKMHRMCVYNTVFFPALSVVNLTSPTIFFCFVTLCGSASDYRDRHKRPKTGTVVIETAQFKNVFKKARRLMPLNFSQNLP